ncbi:MAG: sulfite exporter TauE/SafE [Candidatus Krumholzibacteriia bacterium]|jgi:sulfite exporter TauE/SafE
MESCCGTMPDVDTLALTIWAAFGIGVTTSLGHCIGMCGPLVSTFSLAQGKNDHRVRSLLPALIVYHLGRINSYALIGLLFGLLATAARHSGPSTPMRAWLFFASGLMMLLMGLGLRGWLPTTRWVESSRLGKFTAAKFMSLIGTRSMAGRYLLGVMNGFLPCGPVYAMAGAALASPSAIEGAGTMVMFGLGTLPVMVAVGLGAGRLAPVLQRRFNLIAAILVMIVGLEFLFRAGKLWGWISELKWGFIPIF